MIHLRIQYGGAATERQLQVQLRRDPIAMRVQAAFLIATPGESAQERTKNLSGYSRTHMDDTHTSYALGQQPER